MPHSCHGRPTYRFYAIDVAHSLLPVGRGSGSSLESEGSMTRRLVLLVTAVAAALVLFPTSGLAASEADDSVIYDGTPGSGAVFYSDQQITFTWNNSPMSWGADSCEIQIASSALPGGWWVGSKPMSPGGCDVSFDLPSLAPGEYSWWWKRVWSFPWHESTLSMGSFTVVARPADTTPPVVPAGLSIAESTNSTLTMMWNASTDNRGVAGYGIYRDASKISDTGDRTHTLTGLSCGRSYTLAVDAYDAAGNRSGQASISAATAACPPPVPVPDTTPPSVPANVVATGSTKSLITIGWASSSDDRAVTGYGVYRSGVKVADTADHSFTLTGLTCATNYTLGVDAYDAAGNRSSQTAINASTLACPSSPTPPNPNPAPNPTPQPNPNTTPNPNPNPTPNPNPQPIPPVPTPTTPSPPVRPGKVKAFKSTGTIGGVARIRVSAQASSGYTRYKVTIRSKGRLIASLTPTVRSGSSVQMITWRVPQKLRPQTLQVCVVGYDASGRIKSPRACAPLLISRKNAR
jgi:chitodextrinase